MGIFKNQTLSQVNECTFPLTQVVMMGYGNSDLLGAVILCSNMETVGWTDSMFCVLRTEQVSKKLCSVYTDYALCVLGLVQL